MARVIVQNQWYTVVDGDNLPLIAQIAGFRNSLTIYNHPQNLDFRQDNPDPKLLTAGSRIWIPAKMPKEISCETAKEYKFVAKTFKSQLNLAQETDLDVEFSVISEATGESFDLRYEVPLIPQLPGISAWGAGAAMLVAWREEIAVSLSELANFTGYWQQYKSVLQPENPNIFPAWGMVTKPPKTYTVDEFQRLLSEAYGPVWVASAEPSSHIRVVTGLTGDGTPEGTIVYINDPWEVGMSAFRMPNNGAQYTETYRQFVQKQAALSAKKPASQAIYVAYLPEPPESDNPPETDS